jgi:DNA topoisomerase III
VYSALPDTAKFPDLTAIWHDKQREIKDGQGVDHFVNSVMEYIRAEINKPNTLNLSSDNQTNCNVCSKPMRLINTPKSKFWGCTGYPECKNTMGLDGKNDKSKQKGAVSKAINCPNCEKPLRKLKNKTNEKYFWGCTGFPECKSSYPDNKGKPYIPK